MRSAFLPEREKFHYAFGNMLSEKDSQTVYER